jgi:predicted RNase H-like HicB family nuclease
VATGATREEVEERMHEAIELHIEGLQGGWIPDSAVTIFGNLRSGR